MSTPNDPENSKPAAPQPAQRYPFAAPQTAAGYARVEPGALPPYNVMALIAFIGAFVIPVVGIVCGHITLAEYRRGLPERGREYARAGLVLGYIFTAIWVAVAIIWIVFAFTHLGHVSGDIRQGGSGTFPRFGGGNGNGGFPFPTPGATPGS